MFYIDLDELDVLHKKMSLFSRNAFNVFEFRDTDHLGTRQGDTIRSKVETFLKLQGIDVSKDRIQLLTMPKFLGYVFNPISIYFCFSSNGEPTCVIAEVRNTYKEMKMYVLGNETFRDDRWDCQFPKHFYVSPYSGLNVVFRFILLNPSEALNIRVDVYENSKRLLASSLTGTQQRLSDWNLFVNTFAFPFMTLKVIAAIHWQALLLKLKGFRYQEKSQGQELQRGKFEI